MRITSLELSGFKSFHKKTRIDFHPGLNGIVGPNGCGKSNLIDALRWVTGEQSHRPLRANAMADLISDGTLSLKPVGMAEVTVTLADADAGGFSDVSITRRCFRDGESEYSINGAPCRLKDIAAIFADTGAGARSHSIIGQGEVEGFITAKPEEKRRLIEEVAGIVKYKTARKETWSKLTQTAENLDAVRNLSKDALKRRENLKRQAIQAKQLTALSDEAAGLELVLLGAQKSQSAQKLRDALRMKEALEKSVSEIESEKTGALKNLSDIENEAQNLENAVSSADAEILDAREKINGFASSREIFAARKTDIEALVRRLENDRISLERHTEEVGENISAERGEIENSAGATGDLRGALRAQETALKSLQEGARGEKSDIENLRNRFFSAVENCDSAENSYTKLTAELEGLSVKITHIAERKKVLIAEKEKISSEREEFRSQLARVSDAYSETEKQRSALDENLGSFSGEHKKLLAEIASLKERRSETASRLGALEGIQKSFEWLPESSRRFLLEEKTGGILGVLSDYVSVAPEYAGAFESALGERLGWIVVGDAKDAKDAVAKIRSRSEGRATFIPVAGESRSAPNRSAPKGSRPISDFVKVHGKGGAAVRKILGGIFMADSLPAAFEMASAAPGLSFVTPEGDFVDGLGAASGGTAGGGVFQRKSEIESLGREIAKLDEKISSSLKKADGLEVQISDFKSEMSALDGRMQADNLKLNSLEKDVQSFAFTLEGKDAELAELQRSEEMLSRDFGEKTNFLDRRRSELEDLKNLRDGLKENLCEFEEKNSDVLRREKEISEKISAIKLDIASREQSAQNRLREIESLSFRQEEMSGRIAEISAEIIKKIGEKDEIQNRSDEAESEIKKLEEALAQKRAGLEETRDSRSEKVSQMRAVRDRVSELDERIDTARQKRGDFEISAGTMENNIEYISAKINEVSEKSGIEMPGESEISSANTDEIKSALGELKSKIERFGLVNLLAPEEYEEAEKEYGFLETQINDLEKSAESLKRSIARLDRESAQKFTEAFDEVDMKFRELLPTLFKGGQGKLIMTNPSDPLETGIDVVVKPGGKKFQNISLLSGGEKALGGVAFIISVCLVRPLPFMALDEIDAPLDDSNTGRFALLMKDISRNSQVIVVTHNKTTIAEMDVLIGVTASKAANSAVVSVDLAKAV